MCDRYPGYLFGGTPVSSWDRSFNSLENQIQQQYRGRVGPHSRYWGSMSEGGGISAAGGDSCKTNLIVNYLPQSMTEKDLYAMFMTIGPIESCRVMKDFKTGYSYGFGFVNFTREEDAARAIDTFNGYQLRNKRLKVSYARPSGDDIKETNLYVTNLPRAITEDQLETIFGKYGRIVQKHILRDKSNGAPRGVAFVRFDKREEAQEAIAALNNVIPDGGTEPLSVKVAEEHGKQKAAYYAGWAAGFHHNRVAPAPPPPRQHSLDQLDMVHRRDFSAHGPWPKPRDYAWNCGSCMVPEPWERFPSPPLGGSHPNTPRNGCRPNCANRLGFPNYMPGKGTPRSARGGRNPPWAPGFEERYKGQRCRNGPSPYW
ncbi:sex-lethal homolog isoform X2 [Ostrinia furnacalis]|uniref:sex-lethal homolog isoform X1 n=1 Tax=Ostrinia furnacalis TaxID=93504 RepID=UPI00103CA263|nr:sex-lethal homolog isoform X1 [Ostrinia furnacalis]XP_028172302.1 sex-lethal homolog isoform X2 [Ostrinia furnacalis]